MARSAAIECRSTDPNPPFVAHRSARGCTQNVNALAHLYSQPFPSRTSSLHVKRLCHSLQAQSATIHRNISSWLDRKTSPRPLSGHCLHIRRAQNLIRNQLCGISTHRSFIFDLKCGFSFLLGPPGCLVFPQTYIIGAMNLDTLGVAARIRVM